MANPHADLGALAIRRSGSGFVEPELKLPRRWFSRLLLPLGLLLGFAVLVAWSAWDLVLPPVPVSVVGVQATTSANEPTSQELFKANGWIEPRPQPLDVPVQTEGMYRVVQVLVNPGDRVTAGQPLLVLDEEPARLNVEAAEAKRTRRQASVASAAADVGKAQVARQNAEVGIGLAKREAAAEVQAAQSDVLKAQALVAAADLAVKQEEDLVTKGVVISDIKLRQAKQQREIALAELASSQAKVAKAQTAAETRTRLAETAEATAAAELKSLEAKRDEAAYELAEMDVDVRRAKLELARCRVSAPVAGVVMGLNVRIGSMTGGRSTPAEVHGTAAVTLYDPLKLQVRVEVPIAKFQHVRNGQPVVIEVEDVLPGLKIQGTALYDTHQANIARNSVPVKVALPDQPPPQLRPDMIASVRFQAPPTKEPPKVEAKARLSIPRRLVVWEGEEVHVWLVDQLAGRAVLRPITLAPGEKEQQTERVEVANGLGPTDKLISSGTESLKPGTRVRITGEEN